MADWRRAFGFIPGNGSYLAPDSLAGGKTLMLGNLIGLQFPGSRNWPLGAAALNSVLLVLIAASLAAVMATMAALARVRMQVHRKAATLAVVNFPLMVPEIVTAAATLIFFSAVGIGPGFGAMVIAHRTFCLPFAHRPIAARPHLRDAAPWHHTRGQCLLIFTQK